MLRRWPRHGLALIVCAALVADWLSPLAGHVGAALPGAGPADNLTFIWSLWWMRYAVQHGVAFWHAPFLFAPSGMDLARTHTALEAVVGAVRAGRVLDHGPERRIACTCI